MSFRRSIHDLGDVLGRILRDPAAPIAVIASLCSVGFLLQGAASLNHDVGWLLVATRKILRGAEFGIGVVDPNPPLAFYIYSPVIALTRLTSISEANASRAFVLFLTAGSLLLSSLVLRHLLDPQDRVSRRYFIALQAFVLLVWPVARFSFLFGTDYAQREHLMTMFLLPFLLVCSARIAGRGIPRALAVVTGALAGLAVSLKPQFLVAVAALMLFSMARSSARSGVSQRGTDPGQGASERFRALLLPEWVALGLCCVGYLVFVLFFARGYLENSLPLTLATYWAYQAPLSKLVTTHDTVIFALALVASVLVPKASVYRNVAPVFRIGMVGFYVSYLLGGTVWGYHLLPYRSTALVLLGLPMVARLGVGPPLRGRPQRALGVGGVFVLTLVLVSRLPFSIGPKVQYALRPGLAGNPVNEIADAIDDYARGGTVLFLSTSLTGFPAVNDAGVEWASRFSCLWPLSAIIRSRTRPDDLPARIRVEDLVQIERELIEAVVQDIDASPPDLIFVFSGGHASTGAFYFELLPYLLNQPAFAQRWRRYEELPAIGTTQVFKRRKTFGKRQRADREDGKPPSATAPQTRLGTRVYPAARPRSLDRSRHPTRTRNTPPEAPDATTAGRQTAGA